MADQANQDYVRYQATSPDGINPSGNYDPAVADQLLNKVEGLDNTSTEALHRYNNLVDQYKAANNGLSPSVPAAPPGTDPLGQTQVGANPLGQTQVGANPLGQTQVGANPLGQTQVSANPLGQTQVGADPLGQTQVGADPLRQTQVGADPLGQTQTPAPCVEPACGVSPWAKTLGGQAALGGGVPK
jgi:hypothetical protein